MGFLNDDCNGKNKKFRRNNVFFSNSCFPLGKTISSSSSKFRSLVVSTSIFPKKSQPTKNNSLKKKQPSKKELQHHHPLNPWMKLGERHINYIHLWVLPGFLFSRVWMLQPPMIFFAWEVGCSAGGRGSLWRDFVHGRWRKPRWSDPTLRFGHAPRWGEKKKPPEGKTHHKWLGHLVNMKKSFAI